MSSLFKFVLVFLAILMLVRMVLSKLFPASSAKTRQTGQRRMVKGKMVRDPQCGMHVASTLAIPATVGGNQHYFCSEKCRDEFVRSRAS